MNADRSAPHLSRVIAAARRRRPRRAEGGGGRGDAENNYVAEKSLSAGPNSGNRKGAGARPGNLNAVLLPHRTPEEIALYRRLVAWRKNTKRLIATLRRHADAREAAR